MLPSKRPLYMGNILNVAPKIVNINLPTLIINLSVSSISGSESHTFYIIGLCLLGFAGSGTDNISN